MILIHASFIPKRKKNFKKNEKCAVILVLKWAFFKSLTLSGVLVTTPGQYLGSCIEIKKNINFLGTVDSKAQEFDKAG